MKVRHFLILSVLIVLCAVTVRDVKAQIPQWDHKAYVTFARPVEVPGRILPAGTYVFKLMVPEIHVAQILSADETEIFGIYFTMTADRRPSGELATDVRLEPRQKGAVKWDRVIAWFSPGHTIGDELVYDKYKPVEPARPIS